MIMGMTLQRVNDGLISGNDGLVLAFFYFFFFFSSLCYLHHSIKYLER